MRRLVLRAASAGVAVVFLAAILSCGQDHKLVAVTITPSSFTVNNPTPGLTLATFTATGEFVHPPETRDISSQVVWSSSFPAIFTIDPNTGVATYVGGCGTNLPVTARASTNLHLPPAGNIVTATALVSITLAGACT